MTAPSRITQSQLESIATAYLGRGTGHLRALEFERAVADLTKAVEIDPTSALAHCNLGWTYKSLGDEQKAIAHYRKALEIDPSLEAARDNLKLLGATCERQPSHTPYPKGRGRGL